MKEYNINLKKEDLSVEELIELNKKLYKEVFKDLDSQREKDKKTNNDSELTM